MMKTTLATAVLTAAALAAPSVTFGQTAQMDRPAGQAAETTPGTVGQLGDNARTAADRTGAAMDNAADRAQGGMNDMSQDMKSGMSGDQSMQMKTADGKSVMPSDAKKPQMSADEKKKAAEAFMKAAYSGNLLEVEAGKYVEENVQDPAVKALAHTTTMDHSGANDKLKQAAEKAGVQLSYDLMPPHKALLEALKQKKGEMLASAYLLDQTGNHLKTILLYDIASKNDAVPAAQQYAKEVLPKLKQHTKMILGVDKARFGTDPTSQVDGGMSSGM